MICFWIALCTVFYFLNAVVASSQRCVFALICSDVQPPPFSDGDRLGKGDFTQAVSGSIPS
jgi:hypothetical protein